MTTSNINQITAETINGAIVVGRPIKQLANSVLFEREDGIRVLCKLDQFGLKPNKKHFTKSQKELAKETYTLMQSKQERDGRKGMNE